MNSVNHETLLDVFSMLMERTTKSENTIDQAILHSEMNTVGSLNTSFLDLKYDVYVHQPLDNIYKGLDKYTDFYIETDLEFPYISLCKQIEAGFFDDALGTDVKAIKKHVQDELNEQAEDSLHRLCCDMPSVDSKRLKLREYIIDVIVESYLGKTSSNNLETTKKVSKNKL